MHDDSPFIAPTVSKDAPRQGAKAGEMAYQIASPDLPVDKALILIRNSTSRGLIRPRARLEGRGDAIYGPEAGATVLVFARMAAAGIESYDIRRVVSLACLTWNQADIDHHVGMTGEAPTFASPMESSIAIWKNDRTPFVLDLTTYRHPEQARHEHRARIRCGNMGTNELAHSEGFVRSSMWQLGLDEIFRHVFRRVPKVQ